MRNDGILVGFLHVISEKIHFNSPSAEICHMVQAALVQIKLQKIKKKNWGLEANVHGWRSHLTSDK